MDDVPELPTKLLLGHTGMFTHLAFAPDSRTLASADSDGAMRIWDLQAAGLRSLTEVGETCETLAFAPSGERIAVGTLTGIAVFQVATGARVFQEALTGQDEHRLLAFLAEDKVAIATASVVSSWEISTGRERGRIDLEDSETVFAIRRGRNGQELVYTYNSFRHHHQHPRLRVRDLLSGEQLLALEVGTLARPVIDPAGRWAALGGANKPSGQAEVWDLENQRRALVLGSGVGERPEMWFSADGSNVAMTTHFGEHQETVALWSAHSGRLLRRFGGFLLPRVVFSPRPELLAVVERRPERTTFWQVHTERCLARAAGHSAAADGPLFSPDGRWFASAAGQRCMDWQPPEGTIFLTNLAGIA